MSCKKEIVELAHTYCVEVVFVASYAHMQTNPSAGKWVYVDSEKEAVDLYILNHVQQGDVAVTQDTGLASMLLSRRVYVLSPRGKVYSENDMDTVLFFDMFQQRKEKQVAIQKVLKLLAMKTEKNSAQHSKNIVET